MVVMVVMVAHSLQHTDRKEQRESEHSIILQPNIQPVLGGIELDLHINKTWSC